MRTSKVIFIKNALLLTVTGLIIRFLGMLFRVWLASAIGAEGIGLYNQIFSFYMLASAFASTGINTAVTRMVSEELARNNGKGVQMVLTRCVAVTLVIALASAAVIFFGAGFISSVLIGDARAVYALRTLPLSLPFMGLSSCLKGYFIARKRSGPASSSQIFEQLARIGLIFFLLNRCKGRGIGAACRAVITGDCAAEVCSFIYIYISYLIDKSHHLVVADGGRPQYSVLSKLQHIALPITAGRYLNTLLRTAENLLVPRQLVRFGMKNSEALSSFGVIKGMALPLIFFPASFLNALSTLLIPEMSEAAASGRGLKVRLTAQRCIHITLISALPVSVIFFFGSGPIGRLVYGEPSSCEMIRLLAPIIPLMYMDSVCDGLLKGLDQQFSLFRNAMLDSLARLGLILLILPRFGLYGFVGIMYLSNCFTCLMNLFRLKKISGAEIKWGRWLVAPGVFSLIYGTVFSNLAQHIATGDLAFTLVFTLSTAAFYLLSVVLTGCITLDDIR